MISDKQKIKELRQENRMLKKRLQILLDGRQKEYADYARLNRELSDQLKSKLELATVGEFIVPVQPFEFLTKMEVVRVIEVEWWGIRVEDSRKETLVIKNADLPKFKRALIGHDVWGPN